MKLNVHDRLILIQILNGVKANWLTWDLVTKTNSNLSLKDREFKEFGINQVEGQVAWNAKGVVEREIEIGDVVTGIIVDELQRLNDAKPPLLEQKHLSIYKKFVIDRKPESKPEKGGN